METIFATIYQYWMSSAITLVIKLDLISILKKDKKNINELVDVLKDLFPSLNKENLYRLMRNFSTVGLFIEDTTKNFSLGPLGQELLDTELKDFVLEYLSLNNWKKISTIGEEDNFTYFDLVFLQKTPKMSLELSNILLGYRFSKALFLFVKLGLADLIGNQFQSISTLAQSTSVAEDIIETLLSMLIAKNLVQKNEESIYALTEIGRLLCKDHKQSLRNVVLHENTLKWQAASNLMRAITMGEEPFSITHGENLFDCLKKEGYQQENEIFHHAMTEISNLENETIIKELNLPKDTQTIMDVGGGTGALLFKLLKHFPAMQGILFDLPEIIAQVSIVNLSCKAIGGSFFKRETIPNADVILLKRALHDWSDDNAVEILKNCAEKCKHLCVIEWLWKNNAFSANIDFFLMSIGGKMRSEDDFRSLFKSADMTCQEITELNGNIFAVHGIKNAHALVQEASECKSSSNPYSIYQPARHQIEPKASPTEEAQSLAL